MNLWLLVVYKMQVNGYCTAKNAFLRFFCLVFSLNIKKFLYQEALSKQAKHIVLFKEINMPKLCEFFL